MGGLFETINKKCFAAKDYEVSTCARSYKIYNTSKTFYLVDLSLQELVFRAVFGEA